MLLQTEEARGGKMLEAVAGALAAQMNAGAHVQVAACRAREVGSNGIVVATLRWSVCRGDRVAASVARRWWACTTALCKRPAGSAQLFHPRRSFTTAAAPTGLLLVDALLLATLASDALGQPPEAYMGGFSGAAGATAPARAAPALQLAWRALRGALLQLERPTGEAGRCSLGLPACEAAPGSAVHTPALAAGCPAHPASGGSSPQAPPPYFPTRTAPTITITTIIAATHDSHTPCLLRRSGVHPLSGAAAVLLVRRP